MRLVEEIISPWALDLVNLMASDGHLVRDTKRCVPLFNFSNHSSEQLRCIIFVFRSAYPYSNLFPTIDSGILGNVSAYQLNVSAMEPVYLVKCLWPLSFGRKLQRPQIIW